MIKEQYSKNIGLVREKLIYIIKNYCEPCDVIGYVNTLNKISSPTKYDTPQITLVPNSYRTIDGFLLLHWDQENEYFYEIDHLTVNDDGTISMVSSSWEQYDLYLDFEEIDLFELVKTFRVIDLEKEEVVVKGGFREDFK